WPIAARACFCANDTVDDFIFNASAPSATAPDDTTIICRPVRRAAAMSSMKEKIRPRAITPESLKNRFEPSLTRPRLASRTRSRIENSSYRIFPDTILRIVTSGAVNGPPLQQCRLVHHRANAFELLDVVLNLLAVLRIRSMLEVMFEVAAGAIELAK